MDRKRKSVFSENPHDGAGVRRGKKKNGTSNNEPTLKRSCSPDSYDNTRLSTLRQLIHEVINIPQNTGNTFNLDVVKAATELDRALSRTQHYTSVTSSRRGYVPTPLKTTHNANGEELPPLPPILDNILEKAVFTHPGVSSDPMTNYDRLEVLGDAYIELIATKLIWNKFRDIPSGRISQIRELLVKNETLCEYATQYGFDTRASVPHVYLNQSKRWTKTQGDIFEAYVAAVILSNPKNGYSVAEEWLSRLWLPKLDRLEPPSTSPTAKEALAKKIMGKGVKLKYIDEQSHVQHEKGMETFFIGVYLTGWGWDNKHLGSGQGSNKTIAGNQAAQRALENSELINKIIEAKEKSRNPNLVLAQQ